MEMEKETETETGRYAPTQGGSQVSVFLICIRNKQGDLRGTILNYYVEEPVEFVGILDLGLKLDRLCSKLHRPMATTEPRFLSHSMKQAYENREAMEWKISGTDGSLQKNKEKWMSLGASAYEILAIEIHQRQFSSMQGRIRGKCSGGIFVSFRSALELMRMLHEYERMRNEKQKGKTYKRAGKEKKQEERNRGTEFASNNMDRSDKDWQDKGNGKGPETSSRWIE